MVREREIIPKWKKQALQRAVSLPISNPDISYFLKMKSHGATSNYRDLNLGSNRPKVKKFIYGNSDRKLTYKLSSQIYEAENAGFSREETIELLDMNGKIYDYALENKQNIGHVIITSLKVLYPEQDIKVPWVNFKLIK